MTAKKEEKKSIKVLYCMIQERRKVSFFKKNTSFEGVENRLLEEEEKE